MHINRRQWLAGMGAGAAAALVGPTPVFARPAKGFLKDAIVIDGLGGIGDPYGEDGVTRLSAKGWEELRASGVTATRITAMPVGNQVDAWEQYEDFMDYFEGFVGANPDRFLVVRQAVDIRTAKETGRMGIIYGTQDTAMVGPALDRLATMKERGVRSIQLTYNNRNLAGDGSIEPDNAGLSKLGRATIERIEAERLLLDLSHGGARTMAEAAAAATRPPVISHTGARALNDHPRNTSDATMRAVADKGGVVGLYFMPYLSADMAPTGEVLLDHADHMLRVLGEDHIGIGTDNGPVPPEMTPETREAWDTEQQRRIDEGIAAPGEKIGFYPIVEAYNSIDRLERFADDLAKRGWTQRQLEKLLGLNFLRVYGEAWEG
jgi:membrane dipeptidase